MLLSFRETPLQRKIFAKRTRPESEKSATWRQLLPGQFKRAPEVTLPGRELTQAGERISKRPP